MPLAALAGPREVMALLYREDMRHNGDERQRVCAPAHGALRMLPPAAALELAGSRSIRERRSRSRLAHRSRILSRVALPPLTWYLCNALSNRRRRCMQAVSHCCLTLAAQQIRTSPVSVPPSREPCEPHTMYFRALSLSAEPALEFAGGWPR